MAGFGASWAKPRAKDGLPLARPRQRPLGRPEACFSLGPNFIECLMTFRKGVGQDHPNGLREGSLAQGEDPVPRLSLGTFPP